MRKFKWMVGFLAFVGLAVLNFTQSESSFVSKAMASSGDSSDISGGYSSTMDAAKVCVEDDCSITVGVAPLIETYYGHVEKCYNSNDPAGVGGRSVKRCFECHSCDALKGTCWDLRTWF